MSVPVQSYDLTSTIAQYLDRHMVVQLVDFLIEHQLYPTESLLRTKLSLVSQTKMLDVEKTVFQQLNPSAALPSEMSDRRPAVVAQLKALKEQCLPLLEVIDNHELVTSLRDRGVLTLETLMAEPYAVTLSHVNSLYTYARFKFDLGHYAEAGDYLDFYRQLANKEDERVFLAAWGSLAAELLRPETSDGAESSLTDWQTLGQLIDSRTFVSSAQQLQQRAWLLHWTLFVCFDHEQNRPHLLELFLQDKYLNTIQVACPHLLRYLVAAAIASKNRRRNLLPELAQIVDAEQHTFRDPVTEFLRLLLVEFDFDGAQRSLKECERLCAADFFLSVILADFMEGARTLLLETYLKIHTCVSLSAVTQRFEQSTEQIQALIASMQDRLPAAIDAAADQIQIGSSAQSVYQQVLDKAKPLVARTQALAFALDRRERNTL